LRCDIHSGRLRWEKGSCVARPLRVEYPGAVYHLTSRGNARQAIFLDDGDRSLFLEVLARTVHLRGWVLHAYCLMGNHYHLLVETPQANLSLGMRGLNGEYTQAFNRRRQRCGHLLQGRFRSVLLEKQAHLLELCRYVVLNPVRARGTKTRRPEDWPWSSYRATAGLSEVPGFLTTGWVLAQFSGPRDRARKAYAQFVREGLAVRGSSALAAGAGGLALGSESFLRDVQVRIGSREFVREHTRAQRLVARPLLHSIFGEAVRKDRDSLERAVAEAYRRHGYRLSEIAEALGVHYSTVSRIIKRQT
jgi:putative transposase